MDFRGKEYEDEKVLVIVGGEFALFDSSVNGKQVRASNLSTFHSRLHIIVIVSPLTYFSNIAIGRDARTGSLWMLL